MIEALAAIAPGTALREGLDRILQANMGALVVIGDGPDVLAVSSGGFLLDAEFSAAALVGAGEDGRRHRRHARRVAHRPRQRAPRARPVGARRRRPARATAPPNASPASLDIPVISVSEDMSIITVYRGRHKHRVRADAGAARQRRTGAVDARALQAPPRRQSKAMLNSLELRDQATVRDVALVLQRIEMVRRVADEIYDRIVELGNEGRLVLLQLDELVAGVDDDRLLVLRDYAADTAFDRAEATLAGLADDELVELSVVARVLGLGGVDLDAPIAPRGYRQLHRLPRLPETVIEAVVDRFGSLSKMLTATADELDAVGGVGAVRARCIRDGFARLADANLG